MLEAQLCLLRAFYFNSVGNSELWSHKKKSQGSSGCKMAAAHSRNKVVKAVVLQWGCSTLLAKLGTDGKQGRKDKGAGETD